MTKEQAAEKYSHSEYGVPNDCKPYAGLTEKQFDECIQEAHKAGWEAHEAQSDLLEKKYHIGGYAPGNYICKCATCGEQFRGDKRAVQCEPCAVKMTAKAEAPQAVGPVWVKETDRVPDHYRNIHIRYKTLHFGDWLSASTTVRYNLSAKKWIKQQGGNLEDYADLEWLDENSGQQVFTREDMEKAAGAYYMCGFPHQTTPKDWVNKNYPLSI